MKESKTVSALAFLMVAVLTVGGCQAADVPQSLAAESQWVAFAHLDDGQMYARPLSARHPRTNGPSKTELEMTIDGVQLDLLLREGTVCVYQDGVQVWRSDSSWDVREMLLADLDNDGQQEVAFVLWKPFVLWPKLIYDEFHFPPLFQEGSLRNHLFLYGWRDGEWRPLWCSSPVADPIRELAVGDVDADGANELVVLEGSYDDHLDEPAHHVTLWRWNGWGFTLQWRSSPGRYRGLILENVTGDEAPDIVLQDDSTGERSL